MVVKANCAVCKRNDEDCQRIAKHLVCIICIRTYNDIRTMVIEATPLDQLPTGVLVSTNG